MSSDSGLTYSTARWLSVGMAFLAGILAGVVIATAVPGLSGGPVETGPDPENPPFTTSSGGPSCFGGEVNPAAGWLHEVAVGDAYALSLNVSVLHEPGTELRGTVTPRRGNEYELALQTVSVTPERSFECDRVRTTFEMAVSLPTSYQRVRVTMNGRELVEATRDDTTADLYPLSNPLNATV
jgi:hypothetical protein